MDGVIGDGDGNGPGRPASRYLTVRMLQHHDAHYPAWAWVGLSYLPRDVHQDLNSDALAAVRRLRLVLLDRFMAAGMLGSAEIEPTAAAVNACGDWWPLPKIGARMVRSVSGLDVPAVWGLDAFRRHLRSEMADAHHTLNDRDKVSSLAKTLEAAWNLANVLKAAIGGRYANGEVEPSAAKIEAAWRRFDAARGRSGGLIVLPIFATHAVRGAP
jgi:hypothetical protein